MEKRSFIIYLDYEEQFKLLNDEQLGQLLRILMEYQKTNIEPKLDELDGIVKMAFSFIKAQLDRDNEKWLEEKKKRSEAGKKGMTKRWENNNSVITNDNKNNSVIKDNNKNNSVKNVITRNNTA